MTTGYPSQNMEMSGIAAFLRAAQPCILFGTCSSRVIARDKMALKQEAQKPSLSKRRTSGHALDPLHIPSQDVLQGTDNSFVTKTSPDVIEEGKELFENFFRQEAVKESPDNLQVVLSTPEVYNDPLWANTGRNLRLLADEFARTKEREKVRQQAHEVNIDITYDEFNDMLAELFFNNRITRERIVVLFYFCSDVTIRSLQIGLDVFKRIKEWCVGFLTDRVCKWVQNHGGWGKVLSTPFNSFYKNVFWFALAATTIIIGVRYFRSL